MRCIVLLSLICLIGGASAQAMFTGEGYGSSQLDYFNGPTTTPFDPFVEKYWDSYIHNAPNLTGPSYNPATSMNIWFNTFPLNFNEPIQLKNSTLTTGVPSANKYSPNEWNSMLLKRNTLDEFRHRPELEVHSDLHAERSEVQFFPDQERDLLRDRQLPPLDRSYPRE